MVCCERSVEDAALVRALIEIEPNYKFENALLKQVFGRRDLANGSCLPARLLALRRCATYRNWSEGIHSWNARAARQSQFLQAFADRPSTLDLLQALFAADFSDYHIDSCIDGNGAVFMGDFLLRNSRVGGSLKLDGATFCATFDASGAKVSRNLYAESARFLGSVSLEGVEVIGPTRLAFSKFRGDVVLDRARFVQELWMRNTSIAGTLSARRALLQRDASFGSSLYGGQVMFDGTTFEDTVSLEGARLQAGLRLNDCIFKGIVLTKDIEVSGDMSLTGARFYKEVRPPLTSGGEADCEPRRMVQALHRQYNRQSA